MDTFEPAFRIPAADTGWVKRKALDVAYAAASPTQKLDLYWPNEGTGPFPVVVFYHGGAFKGCDKADLQVLNPLTGLALGYAVVSVNYRLSGEARFPLPVEDSIAALKWVESHAAELGFDPSRIFVWGESAGAHMAAHAALRSGVGVRAVNLWFCPTDFLKMDPYLAEAGGKVPDHALPDSPESLFLGAPIETVPDLVRQANPETWITPGAPPFRLQHGTKDPVVPCQLSRDFGRVFDRICGPGRAVVEYLEGAGHATDEFRTPENLAAVFRYYARVSCTS